MENLIVTDWNEIDTASFYTYQSTHNPLIYSHEHNLWVANSYAYCKSILSSIDTKVPQSAISSNGLLNDKALLMLNTLVRINNGEKHQQARVAAILLYEQIKGVDIGEIISALLANISQASFDWVSIVCKRLPVLAILKGLSFTGQDSDWIVEHMAELNKIMLPNKTEQDIGVVNSVVEQYYALSANYINSHSLTDQVIKAIDNISRQEATDLLICNLLGLFIQSYDACRALLTISAITLARLKAERVVIQPNNVFYQKLINELLRIDPPVHNTRRIAVEDIRLGSQVIKAGQTILVVMGAGNMDHMVFSSPEHFDIERGNNAANLTFGLGGHACIAKYFCIELAIATCRHLVDQYGGIKLVQQQITYEPQLNVKMAKQLLVTL